MLANDTKFHLDINECAKAADNGCDTKNGKCVNEPGSFHCECKAGYKLAADGKTCQGMSNKHTIKPLFAHLLLNFQLFQPKTIAPTARMGVTAPTASASTNQMASIVNATKATS